MIIWIISKLPARYIVLLLSLGLNGCTLGDSALPQSTAATVSPTVIAGKTSGLVVAAGQMPVARASHTSTLLPDGKVLIAGGCTRPSCEMADDGATADL